MREQIVPPIRQLLSDAAADAIKLTARPDVQPAIATNARTVSLGATAGPREALIQMGILGDNGQITSLVRLAIWSIIALGVLLTATVIIAICALSRLALESRNSRGKQSSSSNPRQNSRGDESVNRVDGKADTDFEG